MASQHLRCVFATLSPRFSAILAEALSWCVEPQLLAQFNERAALVKALPALSPDLVVVGLSPQESDEIGVTLLVHNPAAKILLISAEGDYAYLHQVGFARKVFFDFSPHALLAALFDPDDSAIDR
jgi:hypothetical protein